MALNLGSMFAWIGANTSGLDKAESRMARFVRTIRGQQMQVASSSSAMGRMIAAGLSLEGVRRAAMLADEYKGIQSRIKNATKEAGTFYAVQKRLQSLTLETGSQFTPTAALYVNIDRALPELGGTQKQAIQLTKTLQQLAVISGASSDQMKNGMLQFGQAMASGIMRAEEWNSIMENIPEVGARIAKGMGMTVGQLRLAVLDGKVLSHQVFASLLKQSEEINAEFAEMPTRLGQGWNVAKTGAMIYLGELDKQLGLTTGIADAMKDLGAYLAGDFTQTFFQISNYVSSIGDSFGLWQSLFKDVANLSGMTESHVFSLTSALQKLFYFIADSLVKFPVNIRFLFDELSTFIAGVMLDWQYVFDFMKNGFDIVWEYIKMAAANAAAWIGEKFAGVVAATMSGISSAMTGMADAATFVGLDQLATSLGTVSAGMNVTEAEVKGLSAALKEQAAMGDKAIGSLSDKMVEEAVHYRKSKQLLDLNKESAVARYDAEMAMLEQNSVAREEAHNKEVARRMEEEKLAESLFLNEQEREAAKVAVSDKKGAAKKAVKDTSYDQALKEAQSQLEMLEKFLMTELETEKRHYAESLAALKTAEDMKIASILPYHELRERLEQKHQERLAEIERERLDKRLGHFSDFFSNLSSLQESEGSKLAAIGRAAAMTQVIIDTARAAMASFAWGSAIGGPVLGAAFAAAAGAAGGVQLAAIRSAKATGGGVGMGGNYRVNEQGPEMLSVGGDDFLMMGSQGGKITPTNKLGGNNAPVINKIIIQNLPGQTATVTKQRDDSTLIRIAVDTAKAEITHEARQGGGTVVPAILKAGGQRRKAS